MKDLDKEFSTKFPGNLHLQHRSGHLGVACNNKILKFIHQREKELLDKVIDLVKGVFVEGVISEEEFIKVLKSLKR